MSEWMQTDLLDELPPKGFAAIEEHLARAEDGTLMLADFYGDHARPAKDGQIVNFVRYTELGTASIAICADWSWSLEFPPPEESNWCRADNGWIEPEFGRTVHEVIERIREGDATPDDLHDLNITFYREEEEQRRVCFERGALVPVVAPSPKLSEQVM